MYKQLVSQIRKSRHIYVMTGAGISAPSKIPTFRGTDGMWTNMASAGKDPLELLTKRNFDYDPKILWNWFIGFKSLTLNAKPNAAHVAVLKLQEYCKSHNIKFTLVTQNVDGLHPLLIKNSPALRRSRRNKSYPGFTDGVLEIHGNADYMRCSDECDLHLHPYPNDIKEDEFPRCTICGGPMRPHTLLFDEFYREDLYRAETALKRAADTDCMIVIGSELMTHIPNRIVYDHATQGKLTIEVNPRKVINWDESNVHHVNESCEKVLPTIISELTSDNVVI